MNIHIDLLKNHPFVLPQLAEMWRQGLGRIWVPDVTIDQAIERFKTHMNEDVLPLTYVTFVEGTLAGMASLRATDGIRPDLTPWLGSLVVDPRYQRQGIAQTLMAAVQQKAKNFGFNSLYLFTFDPSLPAYYQRQGWHKIGMDTFKTHPVTVMEYQVMDLSSKR